MRITNHMMMNNLLRDLQKNNALMEKSNRKLSTGKNFHLPGENPIGTSKSMLLYTGLNKNTKFIENMHEGIAWLEYTDDALGDTTSILIRARELAVYGANDIHDRTSRLGIAHEVEALKKALVEIFNSDYAGRYIFSGEKTDTKPYTEDGSFYGNHNIFRMEVSPGSYMEINLPGSRVFGENESILHYNRDSALGVLEVMSRDLKDEGEIVNLSMTGNSGLNLLDASSIPEGLYTLTTDKVSSIAKGSAIQEEQNVLRAPNKPGSFFGGAIGITSTFDGADVPEDNTPYSGSLDLEVLEVDTTNKILRVRLKGHLYDTDASYYYVEEELDLNMGALQNEVVFSLDRGYLNGTHDLILYSNTDQGFMESNQLQYQKGDKVILSLSSALDSSLDYDKVEVNFNPQEGSPFNITHTYYFHSGAIDSENLNNGDFQLHFYSLIEGIGHTQEAKLSLTFENLDSGQVVFEFEEGRVGDRIAILDDIIENILINRASLGGKVHRLELNKNYLLNHELRLQYLLSENEDADIAATILDLKIQETIHRSALASGARIIQPSLLDFLR